jgi:hypothetical protein
MNASLDRVEWPIVKTTSGVTSSSECYRRAGANSRTGARVNLSERSGARHAAGAGAFACVPGRRRRRAEETRAVARAVGSVGLCRRPQGGRAVETLAEHMERAQELAANILQRLADSILQVASVDAAGIILLNKEDSGKYFCWPAEETCAAEDRAIPDRSMREPVKAAGVPRCCHEPHGASSDPTTPPSPSRRAI